MLSQQDEANLASLEPKLDLVRDRVRGVVSGLATGLWLYGDGGVGKSYTVIGELDACSANYFIQNSRLTGRGLFDLLVSFPDAIIVIEDCETLLNDRLAHGVLRSALWSQSTDRPMQRTVTWANLNAQLQTVFVGGIIMIANKGPDRFPEIAALKTTLLADPHHVSRR